MPGGASLTDRPFLDARRGGKSAQNAAMVKVIFYPNRNDLLWFRAAEVIEGKDGHEVLGDLENITKRLVSKVRKDVKTNLKNNRSPNCRRRMENILGGDCYGDGISAVEDDL